MGDLWSFCYTFGGRRLPSAFHLRALSVSGPHWSHGGVTISVSQVRTGSSLHRISGVHDEINLTLALPMSQPCFCVLSASIVFSHIDMTYISVPIAVSAPSY